MGDGVRDTGWPAEAILVASRVFAADEVVPIYRVKPEDVVPLSERRFSSDQIAAGSAD